jgi:hypothetical protein
VAHREFTDESGIHWQVWDVIPSAAERRESSERRRGSRAEDDRRSRHEVRIHFEEGFEHGWLAFTCESEKRRLRPIPLGWRDGSDSELVALLMRAERVTRD